MDILRKVKYMNRSILIFIAALAIFVVWTILVSCVDVRAIGPGSTTVGLSHLNDAFFDLTGLNMGWYVFSNVLGVIAIIVCVIFALVGADQLFKRKSFIKVDSYILLLGFFYILVIILYIVFSKVGIDCRPVLLGGDSVPEPSYPSSHTMLVCTVMGSGILMLEKYWGDTKFRKIVQYIMIAMIILMIISRLLSGTHWITDIIGSIFISTALVFLFRFVIDNYGSINKPKRTNRVRRGEFKH